MFATSHDICKNHKNEREEILYLWGTGVTEREEILWGTSVTECQRGQEDDRRGRLKRQCAGQSSQNLYSKVQFLRGFWWLCGWFGDILRNKLSNYFFSGAKSYLYSLLYSTLISTLCYPPGRLLNHPHNRSRQNYSRSPLIPYPSVARKMYGLWGIMGGPRALTCAPSRHLRAECYERYQWSK